MTYIYKITPIPKAQGISQKGEQKDKKIESSRTFVTRYCLLDMPGCYSQEISTILFPD